MVFGRIARVLSRSSFCLSLSPQHPRGRRSARAFVGAGLTLGLLAASNDASASGYLTARYGSDQGTPATGNPYAVYYNPAAMAGVKGTQVVVDVSVVLRQASYTRDTTALSPGAGNEAALSDPNYISANTGKGTLLNLLALPYFGAVSDFGTKSFRGGAAFYIPYGGLATWDKKDGTPGVPGSTDGPQRWHNISGTILAMHGTLAASYNIEPLNLSIGANVSGVFNTVSTVRARNADDTDAIVGGDGRIAEGRSYLTAQSFTMTAAGGLYWATRNEKLRLGLSYTAPPGFGETRMSGELTQQLGTSAVATQSQQIDFLQSYPDIVRFGVGVRVHPKWDLKADFEYVRWGLFKRQCVVLRGQECLTNDDGSAQSDAASKNIVLNLKRDWNDAVGFRIGPSYFATPDLELFGSLGFSTPAVPKATIDAGTIDAFRLYFTAGAKYEVSRHLSLGASYNHIAFLTVNNKEAGASVYATNRVPSRSPGANGTYSSQIGMLNVNATIKF